jgi:hypothetical protein
MKDPRTPLVHGAEHHRHPAGADLFLQRARHSLAARYRFAYQATKVLSASVQ